MYIDNNEQPVDEEVYVKADVVIKLRDGTWLVGDCSQAEYMSAIQAWSRFVSDQQDSVIVISISDSQMLEVVSFPASEVLVAKRRVLRYDN